MERLKDSKVEEGRENREGSTFCFRFEFMFECMGWIDIVTILGQKNVLPIDQSTLLFVFEDLLNGIGGLFFSLLSVSAPS